MATSKVKLSTDYVLKGLDNLRDRKLLCDVHLVAEGATFPAHRVVLAAASPYFQAMFTGGFKENQMNEITLNGMSSKGLKCVLDAIYTAELSLSEENACEVLPVASLLQLMEVVKHCGRFLCRNISKQTCLSFLSVAEKYDLQKVVDKCNKFVLENFDTVSHSVGFTNISKEQLCSYLSDDRLKAKNGEIEIFRPALKWFEANRNTCTDPQAAKDSADLADLMQHVRFPLIRNDLLIDEILTCPIIAENSQVMRMVSEALRFHGKLFSQPLQEGKQFQPRGEQMLALIEGTSSGIGQSFTVDETKLHMLNVTGDKPFSKQISQQVLPMTLHPCSPCVVTKGNYLFLFGMDAEYFRPIAMRFDVKINTWLDLKQPPYKASIGMDATLLGDNIYLLGGSHFSKDHPNTVLQDDLTMCVSKYSVEINSWSKTENLPKPLACHSGASHGNYVFCAGGYTRQLNSPDEVCTIDKLYAFDVVAKIWLTKASMNHKRVHFSLQSVGTKLIACGGWQSPTVEIYDIADDQWTLIQNETLTNNEYPATIALNGRVYVIGGSDTEDISDPDSLLGSDCVSCVDVDNATIDEVSILPFAISGHSCALLTVPDTLPGPHST